MEVPISIGKVSYCVPKRIVGYSTIAPAQLLPKCHASRQQDVVIQNIGTNKRTKKQLRVLSTERL